MIYLGKIACVAANEILPNFWHMQAACLLSYFVTEWDVPQNGKFNTKYFWHKSNTWYIYLDISVYTIGNYMNLKNIF